MPTNTKVEIVGPKGEEWEGLVIDQTISDTNGVTVKLDGKDGASVCGEQCGDIPVTGQTLLRSRVVTVETVTGLTVPSASLLSHVDGTLTVIDKDGVEHTVIAVTSARGMSVITGVAEGLMVRVPGVSG
jgi:hypothetical protein